MVWSIVLLRQLRDWRMGFLTAMLGFMALRQGLAMLATDRTHADHATEVPGLTVSVLALLAVLFLARIITTLRHVEEALIEETDETTRLTVSLRESEDVQEWLNTFDTFVAKCDATGRVLFINQPPLSAGGLTREDVLGHCFPDTKWWSHSEGARSQITECLARATRGISSRIETSFRRSDGVPVPLIFSSQPVMDKHGRIKYITLEGKTIVDEVNLRNALEREKAGLEQRVGERTAELISLNEALREEIAERQRTERSLRESQRGLAEAQRIARLGNWDWDVETNVLVWSDEIYRIFGLQPQGFNATYEAFMDSVYPADREAVQHALDAALSGEADYSIDHRVLIPDGTVRVVHEAGEVTRDRNGSPLRVVGTVQDVTEARRAEEELGRYRHHLEELVQERTRELEARTTELARTNARLEEVDQHKSIFLASMSHELRTPLNSIIGFTSIMLHGMTGELGKEQRRQLSMVKNSANHLLSLINDLLDVSKLQAGKVRLSVQDFEFSDLVREVAEGFAPAIEKKGLAFRADVPKGITVRCDRRRLKQILLNLVSNAIKFTEEGSVTLRAGVTRGDTLEICISDTGIGMRSEDVKCLFAAFHQMDVSLTKEREGAGLGLYLSKELATLLGGNIHVESEYGQGSEFTVVLPLGRVEESRG